MATTGNEDSRGQTNADGTPNLSTVNNTTTVSTDGSNPTQQAPVDPITNGTGVDIYKQEGDMVNNPSLPAGGVIIPTFQHANLDEFLTAHQQTEAGQAGVQDAQAAKITGVQEENASQASTGQIAGQKQEAMGHATYDATHAQVAQGQAAQGTVQSDATVQGQMAKLMNPDNWTGGTPAWAKGAVNAAEDALASRGLGASSIAGQAITAAILQAGIPIAQADAQTFATMDLTNLSNDQQMRLQNLQNKQQAFLSDQAAENASKQFNAQSSTQVAQFFANLMSTIDQANVTQANAMKQANLGARTQTNIAQGQLETDVSKANAAQANAIAVSNAAAKDAMARFYATNQLAIDQSNVAWRRNINTANTEAENNANQVNATNLLAISNTAMNNIWAAARDNASWVHTSSENDKDRATNMAIAALNNDTARGLLDQQSENDFFSALGSFGFDLVKGIFSKK